MSKIELVGIEKTGGVVQISNGTDLAVERRDEHYNGHHRDLDLTLATNASGTSHYGVAHPFINIAKSFRGPKRKYGENIPMEYRDALGYIHTYTAGEDGIYMSMDWNGVTDGRYKPLAGDYVFLWDGDPADIVEVHGNNQVVDAVRVSSGDTDNRMDFTLTGEGSIWNIRIFSINSPGADGNYPRNFRIIRKDHLELFNQGEVFRPEYKQVMSSMRMVRFLDALGTNKAQRDRFEEYPSMDSAFYGVWPIEATVRLCNEVGIDGWWCIPRSSWMHPSRGGPADKLEFTRKLATYLRDNLNPGLKAYLECGNEHWNIGFPHAHNGLRDDAQAEGWSEARSANNSNVRPEYFSKINALCFKAAIDIYDEIGARSRLVTVVGGGRRQFGGWSSKVLYGRDWRNEWEEGNDPDEWFDPRTVIDAMAVATYYGSSWIEKTDWIERDLTLTVADLGDGKFGFHSDLGGEITEDGKLVAINAVPMTALRSADAANPDGIELQINGGREWPGEAAGAPAPNVTVSFPDVPGAPSSNIERTGNRNQRVFVNEDVMPGIRDELAARVGQQIRVTVRHRHLANIFKIQDMIDRGASQQEINEVIAADLYELNEPQAQFGGMNQHLNLCRQENIGLLIYEGGQHVLHSFNTGIPDAALFDVGNAVGNFVYSAENVPFYKAFWDYLEDNEINAPYNIFKEISPKALGGAWGLYASYAELDDPNPTSAYMVDRSLNGTAYIKDDRRPEPQPHPFRLIGPAGTALKLHTVGGNTVAVILNGRGREILALDVDGNRLTLDLIESGPRWVTAPTISVDGDLVTGRSGVVAYHGDDIVLDEGFYRDGQLVGSGNRQRLAGSKAGLIFRQTIRGVGAIDSAPLT